MKAELSATDVRRCGSRFPRHTVDILNSHSDEKLAGLTVFYDGECPVCRIEVAFYERYDPEARLLWIDIAKCAGAELPVGKTRDELLRRFHVIDGNGNWHIGVDAFAVIWSELPGFRYFTWLFRTPGLRQLAGLSYRGFLVWQRWHRAKRLARNQ